MGIQWSAQYGLTVATFLFALVLVSQLVRQRRAPGSTVAWLLVLILFPYVGVPFFLILGGRKIRQAQTFEKGLYPPIPYPSTSAEMMPTERMLLASGAPPKSSNNKVEVLPGGEKAYAALMSAIHQAKRSIHVTTFILTLDEVGHSIVDALAERASQGLDVRILLDGLGSFWTFRWRLAQARKAGVRVAYFLPMLHVPFLGHSNLRNHRKLVVIDGIQAIFGGMNLAEQYMGSKPDPARWKDVSLGSRARLRFISERSSQPTGISRPTRKSTCLLRQSRAPERMCFKSWPAVLMCRATRFTTRWFPLFLTLRRESGSRLLISSLDDTLSKALELASKRGVDVRVLIPLKSNHPIADFCRGSYVRQLHQAGAKIFCHYGRDDACEGRCRRRSLCCSGIGELRHAKLTVQFRSRYFHLFQKRHSRALRLVRRASIGLRAGTD